MKRRRRRGPSVMRAVPLLSVALLLACEKPEVHPAAHPEPEAMPVEELTLFFPPPDVCETLPEPRRDARPGPPDTAPLIVSAGPAAQTAAGPTRFSLDARGARAGRVLVALGEAAGKAVRVDGQGSNVLIYAHAQDTEVGLLLDAVARSSGLAKWEAHGQVFFLDPEEAVRRAREEWLGSVTLAPTETRLVASPNPVDAARLAAAIVLGCDGVIATSQRHGFIVVKDNGIRLEALESLLDQADQPGPETLKIDNFARRSIGRHNAMDVAAPGCELASERPPPPWDGGVATQVAAGDLLRDVAARQKQNVIVGCGGDRAVDVTRPLPSELSEVGVALGLVSIDPLAWVSQTYAQQRRDFTSARWPARVPWGVRGYVVSSPKEVGDAISGLLPPLTAVTYKPTSKVFVFGPTQLLEQADTLVDAWRAGVKAPTPALTPKQPSL